MAKIILTSCGLISNDLINKFKLMLEDKKVEDIKLLYITTAVDGEDNPDKRWAQDEYKTILNLGIKEENITEFKLEKDIDLTKFDAIYMMGGNTFYLMQKIREGNWKNKIKEAIRSGIIYIGSSAGSIVMGKTIELALPFDKNLVNLKDFSGLNMVDGIIIPHANRKQEFIIQQRQKYKEDNIIALYDKQGIIV